MSSRGLKNKCNLIWVAAQISGYCIGGSDGEQGVDGSFEVATGKPKLQNKTGRWVKRRELWVSDVKLQRLQRLQPLSH